jgi:hypothetical protein
MVNQTSEIEEHIGVPTKHVELDKLNIDPYYQRHGKGYRYRKLVDIHVDSIKREFDPRAAGLLVVNERTDGMLWVIDGANRLFAMLDLGYQYWEAIYYSHLTYEEEASIFHKGNNRKALTAGGKFTARVLGGDPSALKLVEIATSNGFTLNAKAKSDTVNNLRAVVVLDTMLEQFGEDVLSEALYILKNSWNSSELEKLQKLSRNVIGGLGIFVQAYGRSNRWGFSDCIPPDDLINMLKRLKVSALVQAAETIFVIEKPPSKNIATAKAILMHVSSKHVRTIVDVINKKHRWAGVGSITNLTRNHSRVASPTLQQIRAKVASELTGVFDD